MLNICKLQQLLSGKMYTSDQNYFTGSFTGDVLVVDSFLSLVPNTSSGIPSPSLIATLRILVTWTAIQLAFTVCSPKGPNPEKTVKASCHCRVALPSLPRARLLLYPEERSGELQELPRGLSLVLGHTQWVPQSFPLPHEHLSALN